MDFSLTEEQQMLQKMARDFLTTECPKSLVRNMVKDEKGYTDELWKKMAVLGWLGLVIPEQYGGGGGSFGNLIILLEEMGRACLPGPFFSTVVLGGLTLLEAANVEQRQELLPKLAQGNLLLTLALTEATAGYSAADIKVKAIPKNDGFSIQGTKLFVPDAHIADYLICVARTGHSKGPDSGITLFLVESKNPGIGCTLLKTIAGDKQCEVVFDKVKVSNSSVFGEVNNGWHSIEKVLQKATVAKCAEIVGGMKQVLDLTVDYAKQRVQFDHPIGSFQAIQHCCANMQIDVLGCSWLTYKAAWLLDKGLPATQEVAMAKAWTSERFRKLTALAHQIHGAIAFAEDHDLHLYYKRAKVWELSLGDAYFHLDKIATGIGL